MQTGDNVLIGGFIVTGTQPKKVIVRAIGPSLGMRLESAERWPILSLSYTNPTAPSLPTTTGRTLRKPEIIATHRPAHRTTSNRPLSATLDPGNYTAIVSGKNGGTGVALVEAYDLDQTVDSHLANISTRGFVETGDNVMIGGFIVGGDTATVALRAIGPSLGAAGIADPLADPFLELHNSNGDIVDSNDNWMDSPDKQTFIDDGLAPTNDKESVVLGVLASRRLYRDRQRSRTAAPASVSSRPTTCNSASAACLIPQAARLKAGATAAFGDAATPSDLL